MLDVSQARQQLLASVEVSEHIQTLAVSDALGCRLAAPVIAQVNAPPFRRSVMDGYAVRRADCTQALTVSLECPAGSPPAALPPASAARIYTGAPVPQGADVVVPQEMCQVQGTQVLIQPDTADWIRPVGDDIAQGSVVAVVGEKVTATLLGTLITAGVTEVSVYATPKIAIIATGNELNAPGSDLPPGGIYNSVQPVLAAWFTELGYDVVSAVHAKDTFADTQAALRDAADQADLVLTLGGVSVGDHDHVRPAIESLGSIDAFRILMKPGKPFAWGKIGATPILALPGNPASSWVSSLLFVKPLLEKMNGGTGQLSPSWIRCDHSIEPAKRRRFLRVRNQDGSARIHDNQDSGSVSVVSWADGLMEVAPDTAIEAGVFLPYYPFKGIA